MADSDTPNTNTLDQFPGPPVVPAGTIKSIVKIKSGTPDPARTVISTVKPTGGG